MADNLPASSADVTESGSLNLPEPSGPHRPVMGLLYLYSLTLPHFLCWHFSNSAFCLSYIGWSKSLCAPDDYSTKNTQKYMTITEYIQNVDRAILNTAFDNTVRRVNKCLETGGWHFEHCICCRICWCCDEQSYILWRQKASNNPAASLVYLPSSSVIMCSADKKMFDIP
jgi:hypothetical protein